MIIQLLYALYIHTPVGNVTACHHYIEKIASVHYNVVIINSRNKKNALIIITILYTANVSVLQIIIIF